LNNSYFVSTVKCWAEQERLARLVLYCNAKKQIIEDMVFIVCSYLLDDEPAEAGDANESSFGDSSEESSSGESSEEFLEEPFNEISGESSGESSDEASSGGCSEDASCIE